MTTSICYVTAYLDIGREKWAYYPRTFEKYLECFLNYIPLFSSENNIDHHMFVFIHDKFIDILKTKMLPTSRITLIPINFEWMNTNMYMWRTLETERNIMNTPHFKNLVKHRFNCPETYSPEYTLINHSKIDFVNYVIDQNLSDASYYTWTDFGYLNTSQYKDIIPSKLLDINKFNLSKITYILLNDFVEQDKDFIYTLIHANETISGGFFMGSKKLMKEYQSLYHLVLNYYQMNNVADDDQALVQFCYFKNPDLFSLVKTYGMWLQAYKLFT